MLIIPTTIMIQLWNARPSLHFHELGGWNEVIVGEGFKVRYTSEVMHQTSVKQNFLLGLIFILKLGQFKNTNAHISSH